MTACREPISWLRLERYRLSELHAGERLAVERHLRGCDACRSCLAHVEQPVELPQLAVPPARSARARARAAWSRRRVGLTLAGTALAAAAALLLVVRPAGPALEPQPPPRAIAIKGGELALSLVREQRGDVSLDPTHFAPGDRFKVFLTCPPDMQPFVDLVVFQDGQAFFPLAATRLSQCGNERALPGAFTLDGGPALVCAIADEAAPMSRDALRREGRAALPRTTVCQALVPVR